MTKRTPMRAKPKPKPDTHAKGGRAAPGSPAPADLQALRARSETVIRIIRRMCKNFPEADEAMCRRGIWMTVVALLFEALSTSDFTLKELKEVAAIIQAPRRAEPRRAGAAPRQPGEKGLPSALVEAVRSVYGANLDRPRADSKDRRGNAQIEQGREDHRDQRK